MCALWVVIGETWDPGGTETAVMSMEVVARNSRMAKVEAAKQWPEPMSILAVYGPYKRALDLVTKGGE
jgi:hypothetical protein